MRFFYNLRKIYVTGASGFLGSHLVKELGECVKVPHEKIMGADFKEADKVFFCSAYGNLVHHSDEKEMIKANIVDLVDVLEAISFKNIESFVYISSSSVKLKIQTMYSRTKRCAEEILLAYMEKYNLPITIIRPFSITGVGEQREHLIPTLIRKIDLGETIDLAPEPMHDFIDVSDVVSGIINLSNNKARGIFELGTGSSYSNETVLTLVEDVMGKDAKVNIVHGLRPYDNADWVSTNFRSRDWGWQPKKTLRQSVKEMVLEYEKSK